MPFYALVTIPLIQRLTQVWYADDASACGSLRKLCLLWDQVSQLGPQFGYFPNAKKMWLVVKKQFLDFACKLFSDTSVNITTDGRLYLGAAVGSQAYVADYIPSKVSSWADQLEVLNISHLFQPLEIWVRNYFISYVTGCSDHERNLFALPARLGGLGISNPVHLSSSEFHASVKITQPLHPLGSTRSTSR